MAVFYYRGTDENGTAVSSILTATTKSDAMYQLMEKGIDVLAIHRASVSKKNIFAHRLNQKDMISFFVHISEMAHAGITTTRSLDLLVDLCDSKRLLKIAKILRSRVYDGMNLSDAMTSIGVFGETYPNLIFVAEKTNSLHKVCLMIVEYIKWGNEMRKNIVSAVIKPLFSLVFILLLIVGMSIWVLPRLIDSLSQFSNGNLPSQTIAFVNFSNFVRDRWYVFPLIIISFFILNIFPKRLGMIKLASIVDRAKLHIPIFGGFLLKIEVARLAGFLSILINAGYKANEAVVMSPRVIANMYVKQAVEIAGHIMSSGATIHNAFSQLKIFPKFFISMLGIGEAVNDVQGTIVNIKESYDRDVRSSVEMVIGSVKPLITIFTGVIVGWMGMAVFGPMYQSVVNLSSTVR